MAAGTAGDFVIYNEQFWGGYSESLEQNTNVFNAASNGAISLRPNRLKGDLEQESFVKNIANLVTRRDTTSIAAATDLKAEQDEFIGVKVNRKIGPVAQSFDAWRKIGEDPETMSFILGQQIGAATAVEMTDRAAGCLVAALSSLSGAEYDHTAVVNDSGTTGLTTHSALIKGLANMGDAAGQIVCWMMHSKNYFDLMGEAVAEKLFEVAGVVVYTGTTGSLNRPVVVTDSSEFINLTPTPDQYSVLGLTANACVIDESETQNIVADTVTGLENLVGRIQGEYAYNLKLRGHKWGGTTNPLDSALSNGANWDYVMDATNNGIKGGPGVIITAL